MADISRRKFVGVGALAAGAVAAGALAGCGSSSSTSTASSAANTTSSAATSATSAATTATVDTNLAAMTWDQILAEAKGQTVSFLAWGSGGADAFVQQFWQNLTDSVASKYGITLECTEYASAEYEKLTTDVENGADATYDMFWYTGSTFTPIRAVDGVFDEPWIEMLPNYKYLDETNSNVTFDGAQDVDAMESPFQGINPSLVYSTDLWDANLEWDGTDGDKKGLFHNFTELASWVKENPGKFTYMDLTGAGAFHGIPLVKGILAELEDDGNGGWKAVYDEADSAATRRTKILDHIEEWYEWSTSSEASEEAFYEKANYAWVYLNELKENLLQGDSGPLYIATAPDMMSYVKSGDLACTFTTCTSIANRVEASPDSYMSNPAIYILQTSIGAWDYSIITANSKAKAASMVIANEMLDPEVQIDAFNTTGNGYNISYDKLTSDQQELFDATVDSMGELTSSIDMNATNTYVDKMGKIASWIVTGWDQMVNQA